jgi:hypothetical protein
MRRGAAARQPSRSPLAGAFTLMAGVRKDTFMGFPAVLLADQEGER